MIHAVDSMEIPAQFLTPLVNNLETFQLVLQKAPIMSKVPETRALCSAMPPMKLTY